MLHPVVTSIIVLFLSRMVLAGGLMALVATVLRRR